MDKNDVELSKTGHATKLLVATDIFGETPELHAWLDPIATSLEMMLEFVSPYSNSQTPLLTKQDVSSTQVQATPDTDAYQLFLQQGGMAGYLEKLQSIIKSQQGAYIAVGFSAGAAALWQLLAAPQAGLQQMIGFYGGQIRHSSSLQPLVATSLIWAQETHFDVEQLHYHLQRRRLVQSYLTSFQHGFINPYSAGYNHEAASDFQQWLTEHINTGSEK